MIDVRTAFLAVACMAAQAPATTLAEEVTIYRCVGAKGNLTLRDSPCMKGEHQEVRSMQKPKDAPAGTAMIARPSPPAEAAPTREVQVIYRNPPRPLYECITAQGGRYTSDNGEGNPRSVPLWTLGYPAWTRRNGGIGPWPGHPDQGPGSPHPPAYGVVIGGAGYTWVRDECHALPQQEVCSRLSDRRYEIIRRYYSAMQSERRQLELEQRGIDARIANDCGNN